MKHLFPLLALCVTMLMTSCASQRALQGDVQSITAKLDAHISAFHLDEGCNGTIKMKRDKAIQINLTKFGIEGARIICTPDSVLFVNKLTKTYLRSSFRDLDRMAGGEGTISFQNVQSFLWNDPGRSPIHSTLSLGFVSLDLKTSYGRSVRVGRHSLPQRINVRMSGADGAIEAGEAKLKLSKVRPSNNWEPNTEVSSKYKNLNVISTLKKLIKK